MRILIWDNGEEYADHDIEFVEVEANLDREHVHDLMKASVGGFPIGYVELIEWLNDEVPHIVMIQHITSFASTYARTPKLRLLLQLLKFDLTFRSRVAGLWEEVLKEREKKPYFNAADSKELRDAIALLLKVQE